MNGLNNNSKLNNILQELIKNIDTSVADQTVNLSGLGAEAPIIQQ